jgi:hypothetical protein
MRFLASVRSVISAVVHRSRTDGDLDEELRQHIKNRADDLERTGLTLREAERRAPETFLQDIRFAVRMLRMSPESSTPFPSSELAFQSRPRGCVGRIRCPL